MLQATEPARCLELQRKMLLTSSFVLLPMGKHLPSHYPITRVFSLPLIYFFLLWTFLEHLCLSTHCKSREQSNLALGCACFCERHAGLMVMSIYAESCMHRGSVSYFRSQTPPCNHWDEWNDVGEFDPGGYILALLHWGSDCNGAGISPIMLKCRTVVSKSYFYMLITLWANAANDDFWED